MTTKMDDYLANHEAALSLAMEAGPDAIAKKAGYYVLRDFERLCRAAGVKQTDLAAHLGMSDNTFRSKVRGNRLTEEELASACQFLGCDRSKIRTFSDICSVLMDEELAMMEALRELRSYSEDDYQMVCSMTNRLLLAQHEHKLLQDEQDLAQKQQDLLDQLLGRSS